MSTALTDLPFFAGTCAELVGGLGLERDEPTVVATLNLQHLALMQTSPAVGEALRRCAFVTADGAPVAWIARMLGLIPERIAGADVVEDLLTPSTRGIRVFLLGADWRTLRRATRLFSQNGVTVTGYYSPKPAEVASENISREIACRIRGTRPNLVLLFLGTPKQELWADRYKDELGPCTIIGAGAGLDFLMGNKRRSPKFLQRIGLEWLFRLACEPRRLWRRYLIDYLGAVPLLVAALRAARSRGGRAESDQLLLGPRSPEQGTGKQGREASQPERSDSPFRIEDVAERHPAGHVGPLHEAA